MVYIFYLVRNLYNNKENKFKETYNILVTNKFVKHQQKNQVIKNPTTRKEIL